MDTFFALQQTHVLDTTVIAKKFIVLTQKIFIVDVSRRCKKPTYIYYRLRSESYPCRIDKINNSVGLKRPVNKRRIHRVDTIQYSAARAGLDKLNERFRRHVKTMVINDGIICRLDRRLVVKKFKLSRTRNNLIHLDRTVDV